jgi:hypothetical protein
VHVAVSRLRAWLELHAGGAPSLLHDAGGYRLRVPTGSVDAARFRVLVAESRQAGSPEERLRRLRDALALWRGRVAAGHGGGRPVPMQLPPDVAEFTGRDAELAELRARLRGAAGITPPAVAISAIDGSPASASRRSPSTWRTGWRPASPTACCT